MKSQSLIIQFIIFFIIGLTIFLSLGNLFRLHSDYIRSDVTESSLNLTNSFITSLVIISADSCKQCDNVNIKADTGKTVAGNFMEISLNNGLNVSTNEKYSFSSIHRLTETIKTTAGKAFSVKPIALTLDRTKNNLGVSQ